MARQRTGLPTLEAMMKRQQRIIAVWGAIIRLTIPEGARTAFDAFVLALNALVTAIGEIPEGD